MKLSINKIYSANSKISNKGFTLIELIVSMFIFSIIMTIVTSVFIQSLQMQRKAQNFQRVEENIRFVLESMAKEIRVSEIDSLSPNTCSQEITMDHPSYGRITYRYNSSSDSIERYNNSTSLYERITSNTILIPSFDVCIQGASDGDLKQPRTTIFVSVKSKSEKDDAIINLQTTISQ